MHIVIWTQYRENYGEPGSSYWKNKGGSTYVVTDITTEEVAAPGKLPAIMKELFALIEYSNDMSSESVVDWELRDDLKADLDNTPESWDTPIFIRREGEEFLASQTTHNNDWQFRDEIATKHETWNMIWESDRRNYKVEYTLRDGRVVDEDGLIQFLKKAS
jgi:hypothetical protein